MQLQSACYSCSVFAQVTFRYSFFFFTADSTEYLSLVPTPPHTHPHLQLWMRCTHSLRSIRKPHVRIFCPGLNWEGCQVSPMLEVSDADIGRGGNQRKTQASVYACQLTLIMRWHRCSPRCRTSKWIRRLKVLSLILGSAASHSSISLFFFLPPHVDMRQMCLFAPLLLQRFTSWHLIICSHYSSQIAAPGSA